MFPWFRIPKNPSGKSFENEVREGCVVLPDFHPERPFDPRAAAPTVSNPERFPAALVYGDPLPPSADDRYARGLSAHFLVFERERAPAAFACEVCSGFLSEAAICWREADVAEDESEPSKPLVDDSATESHDDEGQNPSSAQSPTPSQPSKPSSADVVQVRSHTKVVNLQEEPEDWAAPSRLAGGFAAPEPLKGKACVVVSTQGSYQPLYHEFADPRQIPKVHLFYFDGYSQSPYDVPAVNVDKYLSEKRQLRDRKRAKDLLEAAETVAFCEVCKARIKTTPDEHRASGRHRARVSRLDWSALDAVIAAFAEKYPEL
jgi:hypothetical protein